MVVLHMKERNLSQNQAMAKTEIREIHTSILLNSGTLKMHD